MKNTIRKAIEYAIVKEVAAALVAAGWTIRVWDGEMYHPRTADIDAAMLTSFEAEDLQFDCTTPDKFGYVAFCLGNGVDVISDYSTNLDDLIDGLWCNRHYHTPEDADYSTAYRVIKELFAGKGSAL